MNAKDVQEELKKVAQTDKIDHYKRFFKTGPGDYAQGDVFIGISVPDIRKVVKQFKKLPLEETKVLLKSPIHEERMAALFILVSQYNQAPKETYECYMSHTAYVNNWDLVDSSAHYIAGPYLFERDPTILFEMATSENLWERRIAILSTFHHIKKKSFTIPLKMIEALLNDSHDLIQKAVGWMLREIGKQDKEILIEFLDKNAPKMPRTSLRYSIEHFPSEKRKFYLTME